MKILVTGANGLIGKKVIRESLRRNHTVVATSQKKVTIKAGIESFTVNLVYADINQLIEKVSPNAIVHCAAMASPDACEADKFACSRLNIETTSRIASACRDYGTHLIFLSTDFVFDGQKGDYTEEDPPNPISYYGESKLEAERILLSMNIGAAIIRTCMVFGFEETLTRQNIALRVIDSLRNGKPFRVPFDQIRTPTLADDLAQAIVNVAESRVQGLFNVAGADRITVADFAKLTARTFNLDDSLLKPIPAADLCEPSRRPANSGLNISKAREHIGYHPHSLPEALNVLKEQMIACQKISV
jgi:dTDP-4-dehydrorhamnose reductase